MLHKTSYFTPIFVFKMFLFSLPFNLLDILYVYMYWYTFLLLLLANEENNKGIDISILCVL